MMNRYSRLLSLSTFSNEKLELLGSSKILLIGVGGVGQHIATYLITNGIKHLTIVDFDMIPTAMRTYFNSIDTWSSGQTDDNHSSYDTAMTNNLNTNNCAKFTSDNRTTASTSAM